jgi:hypothetical protein
LRTRGWLLTEDDKRLLAGVGRRLVSGVASLVDAVSDVSQASDGGELGEAPCPAQEAEALGFGCSSGRLLADRLAQDNLALRGAGSPSRSASNKRRALGGEGPAPGLLSLRQHVGGGKRPHCGCHWRKPGDCGKTPQSQWQDGKRIERKRGGRGASRVLRIMGCGAWESTFS